jgi:hypothetical protein
VLLTTEGTYPFAKGGVSTWCHVLTHQLSEVDFKILAIVANPYLKKHYELASNVREVVKIPLWAQTIRWNMVGGFLSPWQLKAR